MFTTQDVAVRVTNVKPDLLVKDEDEIALVRVSCEIAPFGTGLATELHDYVRRTLFTPSDGAVNSLLTKAVFALVLPPQAIEWRMAPDQEKPSFVLGETKIAALQVKRGKKSPTWTLTFTVTGAPASAKQLQQIMDTFKKVRYLTFAPAAPGLFDPIPAAPLRALPEAPALEVFAEAEP